MNIILDKKHPPNYAKSNKTNYTEKMRYSTKNRKRDPIRDELRDSIGKIALCLAIVLGGWVAGATGMLIYILFTS